MPCIREGTVCIFGAGGPMGAAIAPVLAEHYTLRLADVAGLDEVLARPRGEGPPFGWPRWSAPPEPPHEWRQADITDAAQVERTIEGCDAVINLSVNRDRPEQAFRVNAGGVFHILKAAATLRPKRIIQTGVIVVTGYGHDGDFRGDFRIPDDIPLHPGSNLYPLTKQLGLELATVFADRCGLDVMTFLFHRLRPHDRCDGRDDDVVIPYSTAWDDLGDAFLCGLRAPTAPRPNEVFFICGRIPTGKFAPDKAERLLSWRPRHSFERFYGLPDEGS